MSSERVITIVQFKHAQPYPHIHL